jgi:hypothetical protein
MQAALVCVAPAQSGTEAAHSEQSTGASWPRMQGAPTFALVELVPALRQLGDAHPLRVLATENAMRQPLQTLTGNSNSPDSTLRPPSV